MREIGKGGRKKRKGKGRGKKLRGTGKDEPPRYKECAAFKKERGGSVCICAQFPLFFLLFIYFPLSLSGPADSRRNPAPRPASPFSVTGTFCPAAPICTWGWAHSGLRTFFNPTRLFPLASQVMRVLCPHLPPVYQTELPDVSLIPHRLSSSPDWRPAASLFVPAFQCQCLGKRASAFSVEFNYGPCISPRA